MNIVTRFMSLIIAAIAVSGCVNSAAYPVVSIDTYQTVEPDSNQRYVLDEPLGLQQSQTTVGRFNSQIMFMADQIERNLDRNSLDNTFIVTSFTNLDKLSETTPFGRLVAENTMHELQIRMWKVFEIRLSKDVVINETGEFSLSRDIKKIRELYKVGGIVSGTYSIAGNNVFVNARVIDINTGLVASSAQIHMPVNWFTDAQLLNEESSKPMKILGGSAETTFSCKDNPLCKDLDSSKPAKNEGTVR
ncbi:MAG: FlgO family outer membrane protein [Desulfuromonadaceae bacterium]|nr:FlgO family outer membrane protein [Desulfuromonadaceae bacterium]